MNEAHRCAKFRRVRRDGPWRQSGLLREREVETIFLCRDCGRERVGRFRKIVAIEKEGSVPSTLIPDPPIRRLAGKIASLSRKRCEIRAEGLIRRLGGINIECDIERLAAAVPLRLMYRPSSGTLRLHTIRVLERPPLDDFARPGALARRAHVLAEARGSVGDVTNPEAVSIREILRADEAVRLDERVLKALAALARLLEQGDSVPAKTFSAQALGNSKSLAAIRQRLERLVGPLERLGVRDWGGLVVMGGGGLLNLENADIRLESVRCIGLSSDDVLRIRQLAVPSGGVLVVENLTPFQACLEQLSQSGSILLLWSGGFPNRGVKRLLHEAARQNARIRVWCDLDLGGVQIARLIHEITVRTAIPVLMDSATITEFAMRCPLSTEHASRISRDLEQHPYAILADTLRAILAHKGWVEQELLLNKLPAILKT